MKQNYMMPPLDLLTQSPARKTIDISVVEDMRQRIIDGFRKNKIEVSQLALIVGPTVVRYEFRPNVGWKVKKINSCEKTLIEVLSEYGPISLSLPFSGEGIITVEVPRLDLQIVRLRGVLESDEFQKSEEKLPIALGISSENKPIVGDLTRMPNLLIAGMTGQGKSVLLNNIILSLLYKKSTEDLKLILIDTKMVEFNQYNKIARQYFIDFAGIGQKVITDVHEALEVLNTIAVEIDERYNLFRSAQCRNLEVYNRLIQEGKLSEQDGYHHLPYIVVCIDEFADLIMSIGKNAESIIARIAAKARDVGIHVIIATQRQETNVITGGIKVNFTERIAFRVDQLKDSNTILAPAAERLIGRGDMLYSSFYAPSTRIQCCFVEAEEIENVCNWIKTNCKPPQPYQLPVIPEGKSVYRIDVHRFKHQPQSDSYPTKFEVVRTQSFIYPDFDTVQFMLRRFVGKEYMNQLLYALYVYELPYNADISDNQYRRLWVYDRHGRLVSQSACSTVIEDLNTPFAKFIGRDDAFSPGDVVEVHDRDNGMVTIGVVVRSPRTIEQCWEVRKIVEKVCIRKGVGAERTDDNYWLYADEDCYCVVTGSDFKHQHSFPRATDVLPLSSPLPAHVRARYDTYFQLAMKYHQQEINATEITEQTVSNRHSELNDLLNLL